MNPRRRTVEQTSVLLTKGPWSLSDSTVHAGFVHWLLLFSYYFTKSTHGPRATEAHTRVAQITSGAYLLKTAQGSVERSRIGTAAPTAVLDIQQVQLDDCESRASPAIRPNDVCYPEKWATSCCNWLLRVLLAAAWRAELGTTLSPQDVAGGFVMLSQTGLTDWELWGLRRRTQRTRSVKVRQVGC